MRDMNKKNRELIEDLNKEINHNKNIEIENGNMLNEIFKLEKEVKRLSGELLSKKKEIIRIKKHHDATLRRLDFKNDKITEQSLTNLIQKTQILEALVFYIGKKFNFDGDLLIDLYKIVDDPKDDFLRLLIDNISETYWNRMQVKTPEE